MCWAGVAVCGTDWTEEHDTEEHEDHDEVEYVVGASNGPKEDETNEAGDAGKDKDDADDKPPATDADTAAKEPEPDFTITPSKESQLAAPVDTCLNQLELYRQVLRCLSLNQSEKF